MGSWFSDVNSRQIFGPQREIDVSLTYSPTAVERIARDRWGRFTSAQGEIASEFEGLAQRLQQMQVEALHRAMEDSEGGIREQRGTHYLEDAILSSENRAVSADGFRVGLETAFQESPAGAYWRGLETGTSVHVGQRIFGLWVTHGGFSAPLEGARDAIGARGWSSIPANVTDRRLSGFTIKRPIPEYAYLRSGIRDFIASGEIEQALARAIQRATGVQGVALERGISTAQARAALRSEG